MLPTLAAATELLHRHVRDDYQRHHALMVATALEGYARHLNSAALLAADAQPGLAHLRDSSPSFGTAPQLRTPGSEDPHLWHLTGLLHDIDFELHPDSHPAPSLGWFKEWGFPDALIHAVEAHAYGYHGFNTLPQTRLAAALLATDELTGLFYAYRKMNPVRYGEMKPSSLLKKFKDRAFAAKIDRRTIELGCQHLGVPLDQHIASVARYLAPLP